MPIVTFYIASRLVVIRERFNMSDRRESLPFLTLCVFVFVICIVLTCLVIPMLVLRIVNPVDREVQKASIQAPNLILEAPNIVLLDRSPIDLFNKFSTRNELVKIGTQLLHDLNGNKLTKIVEDHTNYGVYGIAREIFKQWLQGKGQHPVTWNTLITTLEENQLLTLATHIQVTVDERALNKQVDSFASSDIVYETASFLKEVYSNQQVVEVNLLNNVGNVYTFFRYHNKRQ